MDDAVQETESDVKQAETTYFETFDQGPGGWLADRRYPLKVWDGVAYCHSPWWLDANHAPPGAGYLHIILWLYTDGRWYDSGVEIPYRGNHFVDREMSRNFTNASLTVRLRGDVELKGSQLVLLVQTETRRSPGPFVNFALTGQPFQITQDWTEQTVHLAPDPEQWTCLGSRHDMTDEYGCAEIGEVLADVNVNIILILFPLNVVPASGDLKNRHRLRAAKDYLVDQEALPKGLIMFDYVKIEYPSNG